MNPSDFKKLERILESQGRVIEILKDEPIVFVGDTHGDLEASQKIIETYLQKTKIVFLGDYVDRGEKSKENLELLLKTKLECPEDIFLLMGNHEAYGLWKFYPADFWESLKEDERIEYSKLLLKLPLICVKGKTIALHGALPDIKSIEEIKTMPLHSSQIYRILWGDFEDREGEFLGEFWGRPKFGRKYFERVMRNLGKSLLIRSHQPDASEYLFQEKCITIFTSRYYPREKRILIHTNKIIKILSL